MMFWITGTLRAAGAAACLAAGIAGCARGTAGTQPPAHAGSAPAGPVPSAGSRALARAAYLGMWQAYAAAARTGGYQAPALDHYAAGAALTVLAQGLYQEHQEGAVSLGQPAFRPAVTIAKAPGTDAARAEVADCADSSRWLDYRDGKPVAGQAAGMRRITARLQPFDGTWKVTYLNVGRAGTC